LRENRDCGPRFIAAPEVAIGGKKIGGFIAVITILIVSLALTLLRTGAATIVSDLHVSIREGDAPTKGAHPHDPAAGKNGDLWFTEQMTNKIGRFDPSSQSFKEYPLTGGNAGPHGLVSDSDGNIWSTANFGGYIGKLDPQTTYVTQCKMPVEKADVRTPRFSVAAAPCGLPCRAEIWSAGLIQRAGE
jgi:hypothetical protein